MDLKLCRICLNNSATHSVFDKHDNVQYNVKIMKCVNILIKEGDGLPDSICDSCIQDLGICHDFIQKCETSDNALRCLNIPELYNEIQSNEMLGIKEEDIKMELDHSTDDFLANFDIEETEKCNKPEKKKKGVRKKLRKGKIGPIQCLICGLMVNSQSAMKIHLRTHSGERPFVCAHCNARFPAKGALKRHTETHHSKRERKFTCETCGNSFFRKNDIITHMRVHTNERPYACPYCSKRFRQVASLIRHKRIHTKERPYPCPICDKRFIDSSQVHKHLTVHTNEKKYNCHLCNKSMKTKTALTTHLDLHRNEKNNVCSYCGMAFSVKGNLQTHIRRMHSEKSGLCSVCLKSFSDLETHMRKHTGEKPFVCEVCNQAFSSKKSLSHHMVFKHENATKFKCSTGDCTKTFPTAMMMEFHLLKQHKNYTPYICEHCSRGFFRNSDLSRHLRVGHNIDTHLKAPLKIISSSSL